MCQGCHRNSHLSPENRMHFFGFPCLLPYLETYLSALRSQLTQNRAGPLWIAWDGTSLKYHSVYIAFTRISRELFGSSINPHLLRSCAATALASDSYKAAQAARGLLGHRRFETTEKYYIHAQQLEASRKINDVLSNAFAAPIRLPVNTR